MKQWKCVKDLQCTGFCVGEINSEEEWRNMALGWEINNQNIPSTITALKSLKDQDLIDFISEIYDLEIVPYN